MRRFELSLLLCGVVAFSAACGSSGSSNPDAGKAGSGGHAGGTAGTTGDAGTGGSTAGTTGTGGTDAGAGGSTSDGGDAAVDAPKDMTGDATDGSVLSLSEQRGQYLVKSVLGCAGCHTPQLAGGGGPDNSKFLSGVDCFAKDTGTGCLASANLTSDDTGIANQTDQQVKDAFTKGMYHANADGGTAYLFSNMPYYQFANLTDADASAIVAYLRTLAAVVHTAPAPTGTFATRPTAAQWAAVPLASYPAATAPDAGATDGGATDAGATDAGVPSASNGRYLAALMCSTCHSVNATVDGGAAVPTMLDMAKLFQGGKTFNTTVTVPVDGGADGGADAGADAATDAATTMTISKAIQSANLTPDTTGLKTWTPAQIVAAIKTGKDEAGRTICSPMRPFPGLTDSDATDIATYLQEIPAAVNAITMTCE